MKVLVADDDPVSRLMLQALLSGWGYEVTAVADGAHAWDALQRDGTPRLVVLDWVMPGLDGVEICRRLRGRQGPEPAYVLLLTSRNATADVVAGLRSGANDYVVKPFDREELQARVQVGRTVVELQRALAGRVRELEDALAQVRQLRGLLPICCYCKKVRDDRDYWQKVEDYLGKHTGLHFSHGICPQCWERVVNPQLGQPSP